MPTTLRTSLTSLVTQVQTIRTLFESKALMAGNPSLHFDYGGGFHGNVWIDPHQIFRKPHLVTQLIQQMLEESIPKSVLSEVQVVAGPERGGAKISLLVASLIDSRQSLTQERVQNVEIQEDERQELVLPRTCREIVAGKKVLVVDDVRNTGRTFWGSVGALQAAGAEILATAEWYDRLNLQNEYVLPDIPNYPLAEYEDDNIIMPAAECNLCRLGVKITKF